MDLLAIGPLLGGALFVQQMSTLYVRSAALQVALALMTGWKALDRQREAGLACDEGSDHDNRNRLGS